MYDNGVGKLLEEVFEEKDLGLFVTSDLSVQSSLVSVSRQQTKRSQC